MTTRYGFFFYIFWKMYKRKSHNIVEKMEPSHLKFNENGNPIPVVNNNKKNANANSANAANNNRANANAANAYNSANTANNNANAANPLVEHFQTYHETPGYGAHVRFGNNGNSTVLRIGPVTINPRGVRSNYRGTRVTFNNTPAASAVAANRPTNLYEVLLHPENYGYQGLAVSWANVTEPGFNISQLKKLSNAEKQAYKERALKFANSGKNDVAAKQAAAEKARAELEAAQAEIARQEKEAARAAYEAHIAAMAAAREAEAERQRARAANVNFQIEGETLTKTVNGAPAKLWHGVPVDDATFAEHQQLRDNVFMAARKKNYVQRQWNRVGFTPGPGKKAPIKLANVTNNVASSQTNDSMIDFHCVYEHREGICYRDLYWRMGQYKQHFLDCAHALEGHELSESLRDHAGLMGHYQGVIEGQFVARTKGKGKKEDLAHGCGYIHYYEEPYTFQGVTYPALPHEITNMPDTDILYGQAILEYTIARDIVEPGEETQAGGRRRRTTRKVRSHRKKTHRRRTTRKH